LLTQENLENGYVLLTSARKTKSITRPLEKKYKDIAEWWTSQRKENSSFSAMSAEWMTTD